MLHARLRAAAGRDRMPTDGLVAWYTMDNISGSTLVDEMGNYDGTITNATQTPGVIGQALQFTGSSSYVNVGNNFQFVTSTQNFGFSTWVNLDALSTYNTMMGNSPIRTSDVGFFFSIRSSGEIQVAITRGVTGAIMFETITSGLGITSGTDYHIVITGENGVGVSIFLDNTLVSTTPYNYGTTAAAHTRPATLGKCNDSTENSPMDGYLDQVVFYNRPLDAADVGILYRQGA